MNSVDKEIKPLGFYSHKLSKLEMNYGASKRKKLTLRWCLEQEVRLLKLGGKYQLNIMTDHKPLLKLNGTSLKNMEGWMPCWSSALEEFDFKLIYKPGKKHVIADAWTRMKKPHQEGTRGDHHCSTLMAKKLWQQLTKNKLRSWIQCCRNLRPHIMRCGRQRKSGMHKTF
jgi:hypothetical protein